MRYKQMGFAAVQVLSGATKLSELTIDVNKNWQGYRIGYLADAVADHEAANLGVARDVSRIEFVELSPIMHQNSIDSTWEDLDTTADGVPSDALAVLAYIWIPNFLDNSGVREGGSTLDRELPGTRCELVPVKVSKTIQIYSENCVTSCFYIMGYLKQ